MQAQAPCQSDYPNTNIDRTRPQNSRDSKQGTQVGYRANKDNKLGGDTSRVKHAIDPMQLPERKKDINRQAQSFYKKVIKIDNELTDKKHPFTIY